jgi:hypothetical protein
VTFPNLWNDPQFNSLSTALAVLTSMITPALLISATGTFILSTSTRLGRCVDRIRYLSEQIEGRVAEEVPLAVSDHRKSFVLMQVELLSRRAKILQRVMSMFYMAAGVFIATSVAIGIASVFIQWMSWLPLVLGISGACFLFAGSLMLILEARLSNTQMRDEITYIGELAHHHFSK